MKDVMKVLADARPAQLDPPGTPPFPLPAAVPPARRFRVTALIPVRALAATGALAVAAVAAVVAVSVNGSTPAQNPAVMATRPLNASQLLLTAAEHSGTDSYGSGKYLVTRVEQEWTTTVGTGDATYQMKSPTSYETWLSRSGKEPNRQIEQYLGMTPLTASDAAAWRAAGSPTQVPVGKPLPTGDLGPAHPVSILPGPREVSTSTSPDVYAFGDTNVSVRDLEKLPSEPAALRAALLKFYHGGGDGMPTDQQQWLLTIASSLIVGTPISVPVRSAALRLMATLPGVRPLGTVADQRGRRGQGFAFVTDSVEHRFVIDASTGRALGEELRVVKPSGTWARLKPGALISYTVVLEQRTTDQNPPN